MEAYKRRITVEKGRPVFSMGAVLSVAMTTPTDSQDSGDVIADTQLVSANAFLAPGGIAFVHHLQVIDTDDQKIALDVVFLRTSTSLGTEDAAPGMSDANGILARPRTISLTAGDYKDYGGFSVATAAQVGMMLQAPDNSTSLWLALVTQGTPTYSSGIITVNIGLIY